MMGDGGRPPRRRGRLRGRLREYGGSLLVALSAFVPPGAAEADDSQTLVDIPDAALRTEVERVLGKAPGDPITCDEMETITELWPADGVGELSGIQCAVNIVRLDLTGGGISDLAPLAGLTLLEQLYLDYNEVVGIEPLAGLESLTDLGLSHNEVAEIGPLAGLGSLVLLSLDDNAIVDVSPLVANGGLGHGDRVELRRNPLGADSYLTHIPELRRRGVWVSTDDDETPVDIPDAALRGAVERQLELAGISLSGGITRGDMGWITGLSAEGVRELAGIEYAYRLEDLVVTRGWIADLTPLQGLTLLRHVDVADNAISDVAPLLANSGLGCSWACRDWDYVDLTGNPLETNARLVQVPMLIRRRVAVDVEERLPDDVGLRRAIEEELETCLFGGPNEWDCDGDGMVAYLLVVEATGRGVRELTGIESLALLKDLHLDGNSVTSIAPLAQMPLFALTLAHNRVRDWSSLVGMSELRHLALDDNSIYEMPPLPPHLRRLFLADNSISDIGPLAALRLRQLDISGNAITSLDPVASANSRWLFYELEDLQVHDNQIADISPLEDFERLRELHMANNAVRDISPLAGGEALRMVDVRRNPLADDALDVLETLRERRVTVLAGETVPYFPAAGEARQGFVRVVNQSDEAGHAFIEAVDDAGVRAGTVRLELSARQAVHFNSADLEGGNAAKGLGGIGKPTAGDWRLSVISALDLEVLSYIRTEDGFVTAMHDVAADAMAPFFNPGGNEKQRSILRVVNTEADPAKWTTGGYDDHGKWHPMTGSLLVRPQHALTLTAQALENAHGLGDGHGKWRLRVRGFPWFAMSLLESPTGHLTNLSTAPAHAMQLEDGATMHRLPLFPSAGGAREGFVRVINRSYAEGEAAIVAVDDTGARSAPVRLTLDSRHAVHFNSADLEGGNAAKGLAGSVGVGEGDWRLEITSELDLMVLAYVRTADGFLTSVHDLAPVVEDGSHRVVFFNPGSNTRQVSRLRVINDGERAASVAVTGIDDRGVDSGMVAFRVPAGSALAFTAAQLEAGGDRRLAGSLGDGAGKWRLRVLSDEPIAVMSLLETPSGHLTNVSTGGPPRRPAVRPPRATAVIPDQRVAAAWDPYGRVATGETTVDLSAYFTDDQDLAFSAMSSDPEVVGANVAGSVLTLMVFANGGRATITVTAHDGEGYVVATQKFEVVVLASESVGFRDCAECPEMVAVPAGSFMQGAPAEEEGSRWLERPVHRVEFSAPFAIGAYEVTFEQWDACVAAGGCGGYEPVFWAHIDTATSPVTVSWHDAQAYVSWLSDRTGEAYRLPSESEWEYAARAGTTTPFHFGETISTDQANYDGSAYGDGNVGEHRMRALPVGSFPANAWGLHDVHGNVAEWTLDCYTYDGGASGYTDAPTDGSAWQTGDCTRRTVRGGNYAGPPASVRSASRSWVQADDRSVGSGIRVVRALGDPPAAAVERPEAQ